jgi:teichuronic acid biosynthesis glycosyltransferase TuaC
MKSLVAISTVYPSADAPTSGVFVQQLMHRLARRGVQVTVVNPRRCGPTGKPTPLAETTEHVEGGQDVRVLRVGYRSFSDNRYGPVNAAYFTLLSFRRAALKAVLASGKTPDAFWGHFVYMGGAAAAHAARRLSRPFFVSASESVLSKHDRLTGGFGKPYGRAVHDLRGVTGIVAVSSLIKRQLTELGFDDRTIGVFPNGIDPQKFHPHDRSAVRREFGWPEDAFITSFVGEFGNRKGVRRVSDAVAAVPGASAVFAGKGSDVPTGDHVLFQGALPHGDVPKLLSGSDVFVLPTLAEGSCNAILEAYACGLPVVTSDREFNADLVNDDVALTVDPLNVDAIRRAVQTLKDNPLDRARMASAALEFSKGFSLDERARRIHEWMLGRMEAPSKTT